MMESGHLISWSVLKIFLSIIQPWIYFFYDIDTLNDVCEFFLQFYVICYYFLKIRLCMSLFFYLIWIF